MREPNSVAPQQQVDRWNENFPVATRVTVKGYVEPKVTRSEAMILFNQKPAIYLEGHNGYFDLKDIGPLVETPPSPSVKSEVHLDEHRSSSEHSGRCYMFPGQGSQVKGMGGELFDAYPAYTDAADDVLGYSIKDLCLNDRHQQLKQTQYTQPALFTVNALTYEDHLKTEANKPAFFAGHSLGEYSALFASGVFDFETGLKLVQKRGALMASAKGGGMAAVIGLTEAEVAQVLTESGLGEIDLANINSPEQIVISGPTEEVEKAKAVFEAAGARLYIPLNVSGAFHSRHMKDAQKEFKKFLNQFSFNKLSVPVISNVEARPYANDRVVSVLAEQLTSPVKWTESIQYLEKQGANTFLEIGPGKMLTGMVSKIRRGTSLPTT